MMMLAVYLTATAFIIATAFITFSTPGRYFANMAALNLVGAAAALCLAGLAEGIYFNHDGYFGDFWTATEALNKARHGLLSSVDFFSPIGPVYYHVYGLAAALDSTPTASTIMHAGALAGLLALLLAVIMLRRQMSLLGLSIVLLSVATVAVSGRGNGEVLSDAAMHFLAPYNRWAWALFIPVALRLVLPHRRDPWADLVLGLAIALLLMLKVTYGAAALGLAGARFVLISESRRDSLFIIVALIATLGVFEAGTGQVSAYLKDLATTAQMPANGLRLRKLFAQFGEMALYGIIGAIAYLATVERFPSRPLRLAEAAEFLRPIAFMSLLAGAGCAILMQNHYAFEAAVYPLVPLVALEWTNRLRGPAANDRAFDARARVLVSGAVMFVSFYPIVDIGMHVGQRLQYRLNGPDPAFAGTPYADLRFEPYLIEQPTGLLNSVPDGRAGVLAGLEALRAAGAQDPGAGRVATLAFANPFPMLLNQPSPPGTPIWLHEGRSFTQSQYIEPGAMFQGVGFLMIPRGGEATFEMYEAYIEENFSYYRGGIYWILYLRNF